MLHFKSHFVTGGTDDPRTATKYANADYEIKLSKPLTPTPGACADFACVVTRRERDRDGDMLEPSGCVIDEKMPLLFGHDMTKVIGKLVKVLTQNKNELTAHFAIADTALGRDAAQLAEFGALRVSHGFKVLEAEPWKDGSPGWHVKRFATVECSLTPVPALPSAQLLEISRVKSWATPEVRQLASTLNPDYQRKFAASFAGKSRDLLAAEDLYHSMGFKAPWERQHRDDVRLAPTPASNSGVDAQTLLKELHNYQGALVGSMMEFRSAMEKLGRK